MKTINITKYIESIDHEWEIEALFVYEDGELFFIPMDEDNTEANYDADAFAKAFIEAEAEAVAEAMAEKDTYYYTEDSIWFLGLQNMF